MKDIQISRPVLIALVGAVLVGGFMLMRGGEEEVPPPPTPAAATSATGATGATDTASAKTSGATGASGKTGETQTAAEKQAELRKIRRERLVKAAKESGMPLPVYEALKAGKVAIIYFYTPGGQDDQHVTENLKQVQEFRKGVKPSIVVFKEKIANKSKYDGIADAADLTQTPSMVILYKEDADTTQGYVDADVINNKITRLTGKQGRSTDWEDGGCAGYPAVGCKND